MIQLGEKIELKEFKDNLQPGEMTILKKMIGNHANHLGDFDRLSLTLKQTHHKEKSVKFELQAHLENNTGQFSADSINYNLFFAVNEVLEKLRNQVGRG